MERDTIIIGVELYKAILLQVFLLNQQKGEEGLLVECAISLG